jgi:branched-chain amino acid transport system substrate-binding protein
MKKLAGVAAVAAASLFLASACGSSDSSSVLSDGDTIKIGVVLPYTGVQAAIAEFESQGVEAAVNEINADGGIAGKWKIELVKADDQLDTSKSATVMRDLQADGVQIALGGQTTDLCQSAAEAAERVKILFVGAHCTSSKLVDPPITPNFYMTGQRDGDLTAANGRALAQVFPDVKEWDVFAYDSEVTRGFWTQTADAIEAAGGSAETNSEVYVPIGSTDLRNQLQSLVSGQSGSKDERGLFLGVYGSGTTSFIQQARPLGILDDYAVMAQTGVYWSTAKSLDGTAPPIYDVHEYFWSCQDNPINDQFVKSFEDVAGTKPDTGAYQGYVAMKMIAAAIEKSGSTDMSDIEDAMDGLTIDTPVGLPMTMDGDTHHADGPITTALLYGDKSAPDSIGVKDCKTVLASDLP